MARCFVQVYGMDNLVVGLTDDPYKRLVFLPSKLIVCLLLDMKLKEFIIAPNHTFTSPN